MGSAANLAPVANQANGSEPAEMPRRSLQMPDNGNGTGPVYGEHPGKRRIRVLRVIARMNMGGPAYNVALLSGRLDPDRYETLLVHGELGPGEASLATVAEAYGAVVHQSPSLSPEVSPHSDPNALRELVHLVRTFRPDIVHTHTAKAGTLGRIAAVLAQRPRPVIVHTYHGHVLEGYFGKAKSEAYRSIERGLARVSDCLIGVSEATVDDLVRLRVAPRAKFRVIPVGLELERFVLADPQAGLAFRQEIGAARDDVVFTFTGRLVPIKRVDLVLRAFARARAQGARVLLAVVGDGGCRAELERLAVELNLDGSVKFLGYRGDIEAITKGCDAAVLASDSEGTPVSLIEAAAAGRPSVAVGVGGVGEVVRNGGGLLVRRDDPDALAAAMLRLADNRELRLAMGERARVNVLDRFATERLLAEVDDLYRELLAARGAPRRLRSRSDFASGAQVTSSSRGFGRYRRPTFDDGRPSVRTTSAVKSFSPWIRAEPIP